MLAGEFLSESSGIGSSSAMLGSVFRSSGYGAARQVALKREAKAPTETGFACAVPLEQV